MPDFPDVAARLLRAMDLAKELNEVATKFLSDPGERITHDFHSIPHHLLVMATPFDGPPPLIGLMVGEYLYHIRSALNNFVCELAIVNGQEVDDSMEFPIFSRKELFGDLADKRSPAYRRIHKLAPETQRLIELEQPFYMHPHKPEADPLWLLHLLSNADRHKALHVTVSSVRTHVTQITPAPAFLVPISEWAGPIERETEIARFRVVNPGPALEVEVKTDTQWDVSFPSSIGSPLGGRRVFRTLGELGIRVGELVGRVKS